MVFWKTYPFQNIYRSIFSNNRVFQSLEFEKEHVKSPTSAEAIIVNKNDSTTLSEIRQFLKKHFGSPPKTPILDIPEDKLVGNKDFILLVRDKTNQIAGCIRYHYLGEFISGIASQEIYCEDCFCIHPDWRKKGIGDYLLTTLHSIVNEKRIPFSMFLKEGKQLSIFHIPFYSGIYVYRQTKKSDTQNIHNLTIESAYAIMDTFAKLNPHIFIIRNKDSPNQNWILYKKDQQIVLACIQDTYQYFKEKNQNKKMGWITCWIESSNMFDSIRQDAINQISDSMHNIFDYIWANKIWAPNAKEWKDDGAFHWYLYQWITNINIKTSYCILN